MSDGAICWKIAAVLLYHTARNARHTAARANTSEKEVSRENMAIMTSGGIKTKVVGCSERLSIFT